MKVFTISVEEQARRHLHKLRCLETIDSDAVDEVLKTLITYQKSPVQRERKLLRCFIKHVFNESKFFHEYPIEMLLNIATLYGRMIERHLISDNQELKMAQNFILNALKKHQNSKMFNFGIVALDCIKYTLYTNRDFCFQISKFTNSKPMPEDLLKCVNSGKSGGRNPVTYTESGLSHESQDSPQSSSASTPQSTAGTSTHDTSRICIKSNEHFYELLFECMRCPYNEPLCEVVILEIVRKITYKLNEKVKTVLVNENLGQYGRWLGQLTLAIDKPVPLDLEKMLLDAYKKSLNDLKGTVRLIVNLLVSSAISEKFGPTSSWITPILNLLAELRQISGVTFERDINHLFTKLNIDVKNLKIGKILQKSNEKFTHVSHDKDGTVLIPPETVLKEVDFIFDHTDLNNVQQQCDKIKKTVVRKYLPWFSKYLVHRLSNANEFHPILNACQEHFNSELLNNLVFSETTRSTRLLLEKEGKPFHKKVLLNNLGNWMGLMTLAKDKPLPFDLVKLIDEANNKNNHEKQFIIPFVMNLLKSCEGSKTFGLESIWAKSILEHIAQLDLLPKFKLLLQAEFEVLYSIFNTTFEDTLPGSLPSRSNENAVHLLKCTYLSYFDTRQEYY